MISTIKSLKIPSLFIVVLAAFLTLSPVDIASAQAAGFYNRPDDNMSDNQCDSGDRRLVNGIQFANPDTGRGVVYYCVSMPDGSINLGENTLKPSTGCPFGHGELNLGGFGVHCLTNDRSSSVYVGGQPTVGIDNRDAGGGTTTGTRGVGDGDCNEQPVNKDNCGIVDYIVLFINVLSGLAGVVITGSLIYAGIQYSMAGSDPQKTAAAKDRIRNAIIALLFFIFGYGLLNYLVPGGVL